MAKAKPDPIRTSMFLSPQLHARACKAAKEHGVTVGRLAARGMQLVLDELQHDPQGSWVESARDNRRAEARA